jgi:hypothetical protein
MHTQTHTETARGRKRGGGKETRRMRRGGQGGGGGLIMGAGRRRWPCHLTLMTNCPPRGLDPRTPRELDTRNARELDTRTPRVWCGLTPPPTHKACCLLHLTSQPSSLRGPPLCCGVPKPLPPLPPLPPSPPQRCWELQFLIRLSRGRRTLVEGEEEACQGGRNQIQVTGWGVSKMWRAKR